MKINLNIVLKDIESEEDITYTGKDGTEKSFTASLVCIRALMQLFKGEEELSGEVKLSRYNLATRIKSCEKRDIPVHLVTEEIVEIKKVVSKAFGTLIVGQVFPILEGDKEEKIKVVEKVEEVKEA